MQLVGHRSGGLRQALSNLPPREPSEERNRSAAVNEIEKPQTNHERFAATFEALPTSRIHCQGGAHGSIELLDLGTHGLVGNQHGQCQADRYGQHSDYRGRSDFVAEGIAYASGKDAHVSPLDLLSSADRWLAGCRSNTAQRCCAGSLPKLCVGCESRRAH